MRGWRGREWGTGPLPVPGIAQGTGWGWSIRPGLLEAASGWGERVCQKPEGFHESGMNPEGCQGFQMPGYEGSCRRKGYRMGPSSDSWSLDGLFVKIG